MVKVSKRFHIRRKGPGRGKVRRNPRKLSYQGHMRSMYMENHASSFTREGRHVQHHKFYEMKIRRDGERYCLDKRWGRITPHSSRFGGQSATECFGSLNSAISRMQDIEQSKKAKGYW